MADFLENLGNILGRLLIGSLIIEYGLSRFQKRAFSKYSWWAVFVIAAGVQMILK